MNFHAKSASETLTALNSDIKNGLNQNNIGKNRSEFGINVITEKKKKSFIEKVFSALKEPMMIILLFSFAIAFGVSFGKFIKTGKGDFAESFGILAAIILSVGITLIMEGSSEKAFNALNKIYDSTKIKVIRNGKSELIRQEELVVGDIVIIGSGDKIFADGRIIEGVSLSVDESALTGESNPVKKNPDKILPIGTPLAERENCVYSGTFVLDGEGKMIVTAVGDKTEIGKIAGELTKRGEELSPLSQKLNRLGKSITIIGVAAAVLVFALSIIKLIVTGSVNFENIQSVFISSIILIVAAVPEGLPTIVAVSLALNMIKLAKENALIKKMTATETTGAVSVICSDKTGTLTENKMTVVSVCGSEYCDRHALELAEVLSENFIINSTAEVVKRKNEIIEMGSGTECALIKHFIKTSHGKNYLDLRNRYEILEREPFSSKTKFMSTTVKKEVGIIEYVKGAPEVVLNRCALTESQRQKIFEKISAHQKKARRVICFAHRVDAELIYDGFAALADKIRDEVYSAVKDCKKAGIHVKILTGDGRLTAFAVAKELKIAENESSVINASEIENMDDETLKKILPRISVIARSTPMVKLRVVKALKESGEIVAVTGDGINDAPAIKHADVGISMGKSGSEITKEAADVVLLDDSFNTIVKAVAFGRNVYRNLQKFILFQLSVNLSALLFITVCAFIGIDSPFSTLQLLWINVIMDGPPAITLGLSKTDKSVLMEIDPIKKDRNIVTKKMLFKILVGGIFMAAVMILQITGNILSVKSSEMKGTVFTLFIVFQLFNAFNCLELGSESIIKRIPENKIMLITFAATFIIQIIIVLLVCPISLLTWIKIILTAFSVVVISELYKCVYRGLKRSAAKEIEGKRKSIKYRSV